MPMALVCAPQDQPNVQESLPTSTRPRQPKTRPALLLALRQSHTPPSPRARDRRAHPYAPPMAMAAPARVAPPSRKPSRPTLAPVTPSISSANVCPPSAHPGRTPAVPAVPALALAPPSAAEIAPRVFVGDLYAAESAPLLAQLGVTHVLSAMRGAPALPAAIAPGAHLSVPLDDNPFAELAAHLPAATAFIRAALVDPRARVLVHCVQGVSRSAAVAAGWLIAQGWTPERALAHVTRVRAGAQPNVGFVQQLGEYARSLEAARAGAP